MNEDNNKKVVINRTRVKRRNFKKKMFEKKKSCKFVLKNYKTINEWR
jgi:hypothetical protein